jgi:SAM-dependent methyltransferase
MQQLSGQAYVERYGHAWDTPELAREYVERTDREGDSRAEGFRLMAALSPFDQDHPIRVLDIGTGQGAVAAILLDAFPRASAVGLDVSEPMQQIAAERMARYGDRFRYYLGDFVDGSLPANLGGPFDVAVSSRAIHHLPAAAKARLYQSIFQALGPGGAVFNLDSVAPSDDFLRERYREAGRVLRGVSREEAAQRANRMPMAGHYYEPLDQHLGFVKSAGFTSVDAFWKHLGMTLLGGYKAR